MKKELTEIEKRDNLATFGVEDLDEIKVDKHNPNVIKMTKEKLLEVDGLEWNKNNIPLDTPTFFSRQRG